jgi:hypothetical protein
MSSYVELLMEQGADFSYALSIKDNNGNPVDLTFTTVSSQMRKSYVAANSTVLSCFSGTPNTGNVSISLSSAVTANLDPVKYVFDVKMTDANTGTISTRIVEGIIQVTPGVTH